MKSRVSAIAPCAAAAALYAAGSLPAVAQTFDFADTASETRAIILTPLLEEMAAAPGPGAVGPSAAPAFTERDGAAAFTATDLRDSYQDTGASRFATANLAGFGDGARASAFDGPRAMLARTSGAGAVSLSLRDENDPDRIERLFAPEHAIENGENFVGDPGARRRSVSVRYSGDIDARGRDGGLDVGISPRAGLGLGRDGTAVGAGATIRVGDYLGDDFHRRPKWWIFAGADREALLYNPSEGFDFSNGMAYEDVAMVGDAQAGIAMRMGPADFSVAYVQRETTYSLPHQSWDQREDFAAFSLTMRR